MLRRLSIAIGLLAAASATPSLAAGDAAAGLQALKDYNLIVLGNMSGSDDVEGKALIGGNLTGNTIIGIGNASQGQASSAAPSLTVGGNIANANININNGSNGGSGSISTGSGIAVAGSVANSTINMNAASRSWRVGGNYGSKAELSSAGDNLQIGGSIFGPLEQNNGSAQLGGTKSGGGNYNGGFFQQNISLGNPGFAGSISAPITSKVNQVSQDVQALSDALAALTLASNPSTSSFVSGALTLNAVDGGNGYALYNFNASDFASVTSMTYNFPTTSLPVIVNVHGTSVTLGFNSAGSNDANNQQVIWNFVDATYLNFAGNEFHGSVLAPKATLYNHTPIEGSVVAGNFVQGGEVHLGTYNNGLPTPPVPEPATWAMMIAGMGLVGAGLRRQARGKLLTA